MVEHKETYCKTCGAFKSHTTKDLYECDGIGTPINSSATTKATQSSKGTNIVLEDTESDVILADDSITSDTDIADDTISTDAPVISDNTVVSDNMIETE